MMVELLSVRRGRIVAVPYRDGQPGTPYIVPSGCVVERLEGWRRNGVPESLADAFALDGRGPPVTPDKPNRDGAFLRLSGAFRMPSGEAAAVYGADVERMN